MRMKRPAAVMLCLMLALSLFGCGKKTAEPAPKETSVPAELTDEVMKPVTAMTSELSAEQMSLITGSIEVASGTAASGGVGVTLVSAMGDGCYNCFNVLVELPSGDKPDEGGWGFQSAVIDFGDPETPFECTGASWVMTEDEAPVDNKYTLRLTVGASRWDDRDKKLADGTIRTLKLKNIVSDKGKVLYSGEWSADFKYTADCPYVELISSPLPVKGAATAKGDGSWAELSSMILSGFSIECRFRLAENGAAEPFSYGLPYVEMKSGAKNLIGCDASRTKNGEDIRDYYLLIPVSLSEVKSIHLADHVVIDVG